MSRVHDLLEKDKVADSQAFFFLFLKLGARRKECCPPLTFSEVHNMHLLALSGHHELDQGMHGLLCVNCLYQGHVEGSEWVQEKPELCPDLGLHLSGRRAPFQIEQMLLWAGGHQGKCLAQAGLVKFFFSSRYMKFLDFEIGEVWTSWV